jgi:hypothetical protein
MDSDQEVEEEADELPGLNGLPDATAASRHLDQAPMPPPQDTTSVLPSVSITKSDVLGTPLRRDKKRNVTAALTGIPSTLGLPSMPPPLTPSVTRVLARARCPTASTAPCGPDDRLSQKQVGWEEKDKVRKVPKLVGHMANIQTQGRDLDTFGDGGFD